MKSSPPRSSLVVMAIAVCSSSALAAVAPPPAEIAYNDTFEPGDDTDFSAMFGATALTAAPEPMGSMALAFNTASNEDLSYDQVLYTTTTSGYAARQVTLGFQLLTVDLIGSNNAFTVLFDTPQIRNLIFKPDGDIEVLNLHGGLTRSVIGSFTDGQMLSVSTKIDLAADLWQVRVDVALLYSEAVTSAGSSAVEGVRINHGSANVTDGNAASTSYLDNVTLTATDFIELPIPPPPVTVPAPAAAWVLLGGMGMLVLRARR